MSFGGSERNEQDVENSEKSSITAGEVQTSVDHAPVPEDTLERGETA